jgi:hypothetical protein
LLANPPAIPTVVHCFDFDNGATVYGVRMVRMVRRLDETALRWLAQALSMLAPDDGMDSDAPILEAVVETSMAA